LFDLIRNIVFNVQRIDVRYLTVNVFLFYGHLRVAMSPTDIRFVDNSPACEGCGRTWCWQLLPVGFEHFLVTRFVARL